MNSIYKSQSWGPRLRSYINNKSPDPRQYDCLMGVCARVRESGVGGSVSWRASKYIRVSLQLKKSFWSLLKKIEYWKKSLPKMRSINSGQPDPQCTGDLRLTTMTAGTLPSTMALKPKRWTKFRLSLEVQDLNLYWNVVSYLYLFV